jgi:hypothetical protein
VSPRLAPIACLLAAVVLCGCEGRNEDEGPTQRPRDAAAVVRRVTIGRTTAYDVERQFGVADEHAPDGALVYHFHAAGRDPGRDDRTEAVTLRFERGVLSKICRARS